MNRVGSINKINKQFSALEQKFGRSPTPEEIAESLDITIEEVKQSIKNSISNIFIYMFASIINKVGF